MSFERKDYVLTWPESSHWHGLEVRLRGLSIGELEEIARLRDVAKEEGTALGRIKPVLDMLDKSLISWNLTVKGVPVPIEAFRNEDAMMLTAIIVAWTGVVSVDDPLPQRSDNGKQSVEEVLLPMEIPLSSQQHLNTPN